MNRPGLQFSAFLVLVIAALVVSFRATDRWGTSRVSTDELAWLTDDFGLQGEGLEKARDLHRHHREATRELVSQIRSAEREVHALAHDPSRDGGPALADAIRPLDGLRAEMQVPVLRHVRTIRPLLDPALQDRYVREVERHILGLNPDASYLASNHASARVP